MKNYFTYLTGSGIYHVSSSNIELIFKTCKKEEAAEIFAAFSFFKVKKHHLNIRWIKVIKKMSAFCHTKTIKQGKIEVLKKLVFQKPQQSGTRDTLSTKEIDWKKVEDIVLKSGYKLRKRAGLNVVLDKLCPVYFCERKDGNVISEGKGTTEEQAKKSALAEACERFFSNNTDNYIIENSKNKKINLKKWPVGKRDALASSQYLELVPAQHIVNNKKIYIPKEYACFEYIPNNLNINNFSLTHTSGLSAGKSIEEATLSGVFELIERDVYWATMRCKIVCPDIGDGDIPIHSKKIISELNKLGYKTIIKNMSLDWKLPVVHVVLQNKNGEIPAFCHGTGVSLKWEVAINRAVCEAVQMLIGMKIFTEIPENFRKIITGNTNEIPVLAWSDPCFENNIKHLTTYKKQDKKLVDMENMQELFKDFSERKINFYVSLLNKVEGLYIVRVYSPETIQTDEKLEKESERLHLFNKKYNSGRGMYTDAILT